MTFHSNYVDKDGLRHESLGRRKENERSQLMAMIKKSKTAMQAISDSQYLSSLYTSFQPEEWNANDLDVFDKREVDSSQDNNEEEELKIAGVFSPRGKPYVPLGAPDLSRPEKPNRDFGKYLRRSNLFTPDRSKRRDTDGGDVSEKSFQDQNGFEFIRDEESNNSISKSKKTTVETPSFPMRVLQDSERRRKELRSGITSFRAYLNDEREDYAAIVPLLGAIRATEMILAREQELQQIMGNEKADDDTVSIATSVVTSMIEQEQREAYLLHLQEELNCPNILAAEQHLNERSRNLSEQQIPFSERLDESIKKMTRKSVKPNIRPKSHVRPRTTLRFPKRDKRITDTGTSKNAPTKFLHNPVPSLRQETKLQKWKNRFGSTKEELSKQLNSQMCQRRLDKVRVLQDDVLYNEFCRNVLDRSLDHISRPAISCSSTKFQTQLDIWNKASKLEEFPLHEIFPSPTEEDKDKKKYSDEEKNWKDEMLKFVASECEFIEAPLLRFIVPLAVELDRTKRLSERRLYKIMNKLPQTSLKHPKAELIISYLKQLLFESRQRRCRRKALKKHSV